MASRAVFLTFRRCKKVACDSRPIPWRSFSSGAATSDLEEDSAQNDDLRSRIFSLRLPKRSATNVIQRWMSEGNRIELTELRKISKDLRSSSRFKHALEISEWMVAHDEFKVSVSDYAIRIDLMTKVFGIDASERYFEGLPDSAKTCETYTALLHSYAGAKLVEKAERLYERMKHSSLAFTALTFNEMMTMYISVGQLEKVPSIVEELRRQDVAPDLYTYNLWISSCSASLRVDESLQILDEMRSDPGCDDSWKRYIDLAKIYITAGNLANSESNSLVSAEKGVTQRELITYDFLVILHAGLGNKERVDQIWKSLTTTRQKMTSRNYVCVISSYLMLGHLREVGEVIEQWKQSTTTAFDGSACGRVLSAFADIGMTKSARDLHLLIIQKNSDPTDTQNTTTD